VSQSEMAVHTAHGVVIEEPPYGLSTIKLGLWLFIVADACTFATFLFGYGYVRISSLNWGTPFEFGSILNGLVMTFVLLSSSLTMIAAGRAASAGDKPAANKWLWFTILLGVVFAALHLREWFRMFGEGWSLAHNPTGGSQMFGAAFFSVTGLHLTHVISGVIVLLIIKGGYNRGRYGIDHVENAGVYWHFVDVVWMFVFPLMYLMNAHVS